MMRMEFGLNLELSQKLVMTPQLCQAIAVLQLSSFELAELLEKEMLENPVLEMADPVEAEVETNAEPEPTAVETEPFTTTKLDEFLEWDSYFNDRGYSGELAATDDKPSSDIIAGHSGSLREHLELQLCLATCDPNIKKIVTYLIGCLDDNGYFGGGIDDGATRLGVSIADFNVGLALLQTFDPCGVGARDLKECLLLQMTQRQLEHELATAIIQHYLPDIAAGKVRYVAEQLKVTPQAIQAAVDFIRTLDPKPGSSFGSGTPHYIAPDVSIERIDGNYTILVNDNLVPRLIINPYYRRVIADIDSDSKKFVEGRLNSALWLLKSIEQRRRTLYNVAEALVDLQRDFFDYGPLKLKPLTMRTVADRIGVHESTVSRATANKYAATPHGLVHFRTFFTSGVSSVNGDTMSASTVKRFIRDLVAAEQPARPLSDQTIANELAKIGASISRRTVTKYREELGIAASSRRKRY